MEVIFFLSVLLLFNIVNFLYRKISGKSVIPNSLACGLVGYSGAGAADMSIIKLLMLYNLERGKDATGVLIDSKLTKDVESVEKFLANNNEIFRKQKAIEKTTTIIGHTRAATAGIAKIKRNAHPFVVQSTEDPKPVFYMAMNGSITNMYELNKQFESNWEYNDSDSLHLAIMMALYPEKRNEILKVYKGAANLLYYFETEKNTLWVWKDPERPLFYWINKNSIYISSIKESLVAAGADSDSVVSFEDYHIYKIVNGEIVENTKLFTPAVVETGNASNFKGKGRQASMYNEGGQGGAANEVPFHQTTGSGVGTKQDTWPIYEFRETNNVSYRQNIRYLDGVYTFSGDPFSGIAYCNELGNIYSEQLDSKNRDLFKKYFFISGRCIKDEVSYDKLLSKILSDNKKVKSISVKSFDSLASSLLSEFTILPVPAASNVVGAFTYFKDGKPLKDEFVIKPPFSRSKITYRKGMKPEVTYVDTAEETGKESKNPISWGDLAFTSNDVKEILKKNYIKDNDSAYELVVQFMSDFSMNWSFDFVYSVVDSLLELAVDENMINADDCDNLLVKVHRTSTGLAELPKDLWAELTRIVKFLKPLYKDGEKEKELKRISRSQTNGYVKAELELENGIIDDVVHNSEFVKNFENCKYDSIEALLKAVLSPNPAVALQVRYVSTVLYLMHLNDVLGGREYIDLTSGLFSLDALKKEAEKYYEKYKQKIQSEN